MPDDPDETILVADDPGPDHREAEAAPDRKHLRAPLGDPVVHPAFLHLVDPQLVLHRQLPSKVAISASATTLIGLPESWLAFRSRA